MSPPGRPRPTSLWFSHMLKENQASIWLRSAKERIKYNRFVNNLLSGDSPPKGKENGHSSRSKRRRLGEPLHTDPKHPDDLSGHHRADHGHAPANLYRRDCHARNWDLRWRRGHCEGCRPSVQTQLTSASIAGDHHHPLGRSGAGTPALALLLAILILAVPAGAVSIKFADNNMIQGYSIDLYNFTEGSTTFVSQWNASVVDPIVLDPNTSYIAIIRQNQVSRLNNMNELAAESLSWVQANFIGLFFVGILLAFLMSRR